MEFQIAGLGVKAKIKIPLSGTGFNVRQSTLHIDNLPESWPMETESAWRERFCKVDFTFQDIVEHLQAESFTDDIFEYMRTQKPLDGLQCSIPESVCEGFLLKNLLWYSSANHHHLIIIIVISSSSSSHHHHHLIIISSSSSSHHHLTIFIIIFPLSLSCFSFLF